MLKETIILLYGGRSAERDVSVLSAESLIQAIDYQRFTVKTYFISQAGDFIKTQEFSQQPDPDEQLLTNANSHQYPPIKPSDIYDPKAIVFPILHGPSGEDGAIQGFLETLKMPYVGTNVLSSSVAMDKIVTKHILASVGIPQVDYCVYLAGNDIQECLNQVKQRLYFPVFVKPANMGSSVGISKVSSEADLKPALEEALRYDSRLLIEQGVDAREIEVGILGNEVVQTSLPGEVIKNVAFYDYQAKYVDNQIEMAIPAQLDQQVINQMRDYAKRSFQAIGGCGLARCDFFLTASGEVFLNELNTMPGFTQWSMYPLLWENMGLAYTDLITELVNLAKSMFERREQYLI